MGGKVVQMLDRFQLSKCCFSSLQSAAIDAYAIAVENDEQCVSGRALLAAYFFKKSVEKRKPSHQ
jgi:hypothetical protein